MKRLFASIVALNSLILNGANFCDLSLNGTWECGFDRVYDTEVIVPGIAVDPSQMTDKYLWYRKMVTMPDGDWNRADLELKGARFRPRVYVNGVLVSSREGGMAKTTHSLDYLKPGETALLEIALAPLSEVPLEDASRIPEVDQWRSNVSSCLWDDVDIILYRDARVDRVLTTCDSGRKKAILRYRVKGDGAATARIIISDGDSILVDRLEPVETGENEMILNYRNILEEWKTGDPKCYRLEVQLMDGQGVVLSEYGQTLNLRDFRINRKQFYLNGRQIRACGGSVVWHRWMRDEEAAEVGFDKDWFVSNVILPMKERGANYLRFHLGVPPERLLDACDEHGMMVQYEWSFFHGMPASEASLREQYSSWLDMASRHPSAVIFHPYNETEPEELLRVDKVLDSLETVYPPMVLEDRQVINLHRYWWGMSENLGLYYDSYRQFILPVMVDEYGGIYLDGNYGIGGYPMLRPAMKRWLGENHTAADRSRQQILAYSKVGEYWRRTGVAGVAAFPVICSFQDGNHWYEGPIRDGRLKPVWDTMPVVWSSRTASFDVWDRNYVPGQNVRMPLHFINDSDKGARMTAEIGIGSMKKTVSCFVRAHHSKIRKVRVTMPLECGQYVLRASLVEGSPVSKPVESVWDVNVVAVKVPEAVASARIFIPEEEKELRKMAKVNSLNVTDDIASSDIALLGRDSWNRISEIKEQLHSAVLKGTSVILLDIGDRNLGKSYDDTQKNLGNTSGAPRISSAEIVSTPLFSGLTVSTVQVAEGESHIHPSSADSTLWNGLSPENTRLWNGLRGGIIVPASNLEVSGLSQEAFVSIWKERGADGEEIRKGPYFGYEYCGFYAYADNGNSAEAEKLLRDKVAFLVEDMPAMAIFLPRNTPIRVTDLHSAYMANEGVSVSGVSPLAVAGKNLVRTPVIRIEFSDSEGVLILSQLLTAGRLAEGFTDGRKVRPVEYDPAAVSVVLNMMENALEK